MSRVYQAWNRFFYTPTSAMTLGVFRAFFGLLVFIAVLGVFPYRDIFYAFDGIVLPEVMQKLFADRWMILGFSFLPTHEPWMGVFMVGLMVAALMLSLGFYSRMASFAVFLGIFSLHNRNFFVTNAGDLLLRIDCLILVFADCGAALSLDRWCEIRRARVAGGEPGAARLVSPWPLRVMQLQVTYLYLMTAVLKFSGASWRDGTALYYALRYLELQRFSFSFLFHYLWQIKLATWGTLFAETLMGTLVWVRKLRYPILVAALLLHTGINLIMQFPVFQYVMMVNLILFIYPEDLSRLVQRWSGGGPRGCGELPAAARHEESLNVNGQRW